MAVRIIEEQLAPAERKPSNVWFERFGSPEGCGPDMVAVAKAMETALAGRHLQCLRYAKLAYNQPLMTSLYDTAGARTEWEDLYLSWNICASAVTTAETMIVRNRPRVVFETTGGDHGLRIQARKANKFVFGCWSENKVYERHAPQVFRDAATFGLGIFWLSVEGGRVKIERTLPTELLFSERQWIYGDGAEIGRFKNLDRSVVMANWGDTPAKQAAIRAVLSRSDVPSDSGLQADTIPVYEFYRRPSGPDKDDGVHVIAVENCTLLEERWKHNWLPVVFYRVEDRPLGLWGIGFVERLIGFQIRLNELNDAIDEMVRKLASPKWMNPLESQANPDDLTTNEVGAVVNYASGFRPDLVTYPALPGELVNERRETYQQGLREIGLSEWSVNAVKPAGVSSGEALRTVRDQEQGRMITVGQDWEACFVELAEKTIFMAADAAKESKTGYTVLLKMPGHRFVESVDFGKISDFVASAAWLVKGYPVSMLPTHPGARLQKLEEWLGKGMIDKPTFAMLSEMPDLDSESSLMNAAIEDIHWTLERILEDGEDGYLPPEPGQALELGIRIFQAANQRARAEGVPEEIRYLIQRWIDGAQELLTPPEPVETEDGGGAAGGGGEGPADTQMPVDPAEATPVGPPPVEAEVVQGAPVEEAPPAPPLEVVPGVPQNPALPTDTPPYREE